MTVLDRKIICLFLITAFVLLNVSIIESCSKTAGYSIPDVVKKEKWTQVGNDLFVFTSSFYLVNIVLAVSGDEAILIDTGNDENDRTTIENFLKERNLKLKNIIITHMHADHSSNLNSLETENIAPITPSNAKNNQTVKLGNRTLKVIFTEGHYKPKGHISVEIVNEGILIAGDVICNNIIPPLAAGGNFKDLVNTLSKLKKKNYSLVIPGHGDIVNNDVIFHRQFEYLNNARIQVENVISSGGKLLDLDNINLEECIKDTSYLYPEQLDYWHKMTLHVIYVQLKK